MYTWWQRGSGRQGFENILAEQNKERDQRVDVTNILKDISLGKKQRHFSTAVSLALLQRTNNLPKSL